LNYVQLESIFQWLEDLIHSYNSTDIYQYEIPPLGDHYSIIWAKEELEIQKMQSSLSPRPCKRLKFSERISPDVVEILHKANNYM